MKDNNLKVINSSEMVSVGQNQYMNLIETAVEKQVDIAYLKELMDLQDRYDAKIAKQQFFAAMSEFQSLVPVIEKKGVVDYKSSKGQRTNYKFGRFEDIIQAIKPALKKTGLSFRHITEQGNGGMKMICTINHVGGHSEVNQLFSALDVSGGKDALKSVASTVSYLRRYTLISGFGIVVGGEDTEDFGNIFAGSEVTNEDVIDIYPDASFDKVFPAWEKAIKSGKKTNQQIVDAGNKQGVKFSDEQLNTIYSVGKA